MFRSLQSFPNSFTAAARDRELSADMPVAAPVTGAATALKWGHGLRIRGQTIQAVVFAGSMPPSSGALLTTTVPSGSATGSVPKFVTDCQPLGRTK